MTRRIADTGETLLRQLRKDVNNLQRQQRGPDAARLQGVIDQIVGDPNTPGSGLTPAAPIELVASSELYVFKRVQQARVYLAFPPVTVSTTAQPVDIDVYEMQGRVTGGDTWTLLDTAGGPALKASGLQPGVSYELRARAVGFDLPGQWSAVVTVLAQGDDIPPGPPTTPVAIQKLGVAHFYWNGKFGSGATEPPADLDRVEAEVSVDGGAFVPTGQFSTTATTFTFANYASGQTLAVRLVAYDFTGNASPPSGVALVTLTATVDASLIDTSITEAIAANEQAVNAAIEFDTLLRTDVLAIGPDNKIILANGVVTAENIFASALMSARMAEFLQVTTDKLSANAVTADKLAVGAVSAESIALGAVKPTALAFNGDEMLPNPKWLYPQLRDEYVPPAGFAYTSSSSTIPSSQTHTLFSGGSSTPASVGNSFAIGPLHRVVPGEKIYLRQVSRVNSTSLNATAHELAVSVQAVDGSSLGILGTGVTSGTLDSTLREYDAVVTMPSGAAAIIPIIRIVGTGSVTGLLYTSAVSMKRVLASGQDGVDLRQQVQISPRGGIFGNEQGQHSSISWAGFSVWTGNAASETGLIQVTKLGQFDDEVLSIGDPDTGEVVASIDNQGEVAGQTVSSVNDMVIGGRQLLGPFVQPVDEVPDRDSYFWNIPWGNRAWADLKEVALTYVADRQDKGIAQIEFTALAGRAYEARITSPQIDLDNYFAEDSTSSIGCGLGLVIEKSTDGSEPQNPTPDSERIVVVNEWPEVDRRNPLVAPLFGVTPSIETVFSFDQDTRLKVLTFLRAFKCRATMGALTLNSSSWQLIINDIGPKIPATAVRNHSTNLSSRPIVGTKKTYRTYWEPDSWRSYQGFSLSPPDGGNNDRVGQGWTDGMSAPRRGVARFSGVALRGDEKGKTITQALSGASNITVRVRAGVARSVRSSVKARFGWADSWTAARVGAKSSVLIPRSNTRSTTLPIGSWMRASSTNRYIIFGPGSPDSTLDYAEFWAQGYGANKDLQVEITYTK